MHRPAIPPLLALPAALVLAAAARAAGDCEEPAFADSLVTWEGLSHVPWQDRAPIVPVRDEPFTVRFQSLSGDLTGARVRQFVAGTPDRVFEASVVATRGPYDIWEAQCDGRDAPQVRYDIEVTDIFDVDYLGVSGPSDGPPVGAEFLLDFDTWSHAPAGSTPATGGVVFRTWAPSSTQVYVRGSFNAWGLTDPMTKVGEDFIAFVASAQSGDEYKYFFSQTQTWSPDAFARRLDPADFFNSVVVDPVGYDWQTPPFSPPCLEEMVVYQLHVGSFAGLNDPNGFAPNPSRFTDVAARAPHLASLGVNVVYLNPIVEWPGDFSGGYNPLNLTSLESALGTPEECKAMVDELHAHGIAVIGDFVFNHLQPFDNLLEGYTGPPPVGNVWFDTPPASTNFGPQPDFDEPRVRQLVLDTLVMFLDEYRFDGFRVDGISELSFGPQPSASNQLMRDLNDLVDNRWRDKPMIAEIFGDDPWFTRPTASGGLGFDAQYHTFYKDAVRNSTFGAAFGSQQVAPLNQATTDSFGELQGAKLFNYFELHDDTWPLNDNQRAVRTIDTTFPHDDVFATGRTKLAHGVTLLSRGVPAILMGTEWLEDNDWEAQKLDWNHKLFYPGVLAYYRDLIELRTSRPELFADAPASGFHTNESSDVFAFERSESGAGSFVVVVNYGDQDWDGPGGYRVGLPRPGEWGVAINSQASAYGGSGVGTSGTFVAEPVPWQGFPQSVALELPARGLLVLEHEPGAGVQPLEATPDTLSLTAGGTQAFDLTAGSDRAGDLYFLLGTLSGTSPGLSAAPGEVLPLNLDAYLLFTLANPNTALLQTTLGFLDGSGGGQAALALPPGGAPALAGSTANHAYVAFDPATLDVTLVSNAVSLALLP